MKIREDIRKLTTTQTNLARALNLTQPRISQLIEEGVIIRDDKDPSGGVMLLRSLQNYYSTKQQDNDVDFWLEKARHEKVKREISELKLLKEQGSAYDAEEVERVIAEVLTDFKNKLLGLGHKLAGQLQGLSVNEMCELIDLEVENNLVEMAADLDEELSGITPADEKIDESAAAIKRE